MDNKELGRDPLGQALVQAPSPTVSALSDFDPSRCLPVTRFYIKTRVDRGWRRWGGYYKTEAQCRNAAQVATENHGRCRIIKQAILIHEDVVDDLLRPTSVTLTQEGKR